MSKGALILEALKARLETISTGAGYGVTVKNVYLNEGQVLMLTSANDLPALDIIDDGEDYEHHGSSSYIALTTLVILLYAPKEYTDGMMQDFMSDVRRCLYGGVANATGNTGMTLGGLVMSIELDGSAGDLNSFENHRMYVMRIRLKSQRTTFRD